MIWQVTEKEKEGLEGAKQEAQRVVDLERDLRQVLYDTHCCMWQQ